MSWFTESKRSLMERMAINVLKCGSIPRHVAFIMDGNRRYARRLDLSAIDGHKRGFERMTQMLEWCLDLGVDEVTVYAFAIDNFRRPAEEVDKLMDFAKDMFDKLLNDRHKLNETGKAVRVFGDLSRLRPDIQRLVADIVLFTQHNTRKVLNICFPYASRHEITTALQELQICVQNQIIEESDITESLISNFLYTSQSSDPDLLVRTSGEVRLSDFLLWQTSFSVIAFAPVLWPDFTIWDLFSAILYYQRNCSSAKSEQQLHELTLGLTQPMDHNNHTDHSSRRQRLTNCLLYLHNKRITQMTRMSSNGNQVVEVNT
ncbi:unnamed protein product [Medioppia subpectinata]|uniref:Alkyl transferase n=1 Tax=Medioppia subpectinata TaxID=1979941 RepID=A0A7R9KRR6_9ACAR|nr:unnamed protein product [Medioppia subpectinata]CAG2107419.1 unnamed protein product [Medioppia subpectinata]